MIGQLNKQTDFIYIYLYMSKELYYIDYIIHTIVKIL